MSESVGHRRITVRMRFPRIAFVFACAVSLVLPLAAQSPNGTINGRVVDPSSEVIAGADILVINDVTGVKYPSKTNDDGIYVVPNLPPGPYRLQVSKVGFKTLIKPDIVLNIQDALSINFTLPVGAVFESVTVEGGASMINTTDASVSTVIDHSYVENMPLNGRSFQDLILLTPGVVTNSPQSSGGLGYSGEFSVNGQRTESNYYTVDGVSGNVGIQAGNPVAPSVAGALPSATALGTTQALLSVDAMEEFRVQSSTYSAEYGRSPGGQFSFATRAGTNQWHGTAYDYLRNNSFDANNWFNDYYQLPESALRQNDFGATLGGPVAIPNVYNGKDATFFFFSYEGLRLLQPQEASINYVPTTALRSSAPSALQPVLNAFPLPTPASPNCVADLGNGLGEFCSPWSNPSSIDSYSIRLDQIFNQRLRLFFRFGDTPSNSDSRQSPGSEVAFNDYVTRTYTIGATGSFTGHLSNDLRLNYSSNENTAGSKFDNFGGAQTANFFQLQGVNVGATPNPAVAMVFGFPGYPTALTQSLRAGQQKQWNLVDTMDFSSGKHQIRYGVDYRRLTPISNAANPLIELLFLSEASVQANSVDIGEVYSEPTAFPLYTNFSAFVQDEWKVWPQLSLSGGLRWDVNPAPSVTRGLLPYTVQGATLATLTLAPEGTPLWKTSWFNFAPRLGAAYVLRDRPRYETVVRGGVGVFFDTGQQLGSYGYLGPGFSALNEFGGLLGTPASFPVPMSAIPSVVNPPLPPYGATYAFPAHLQLPFTLQWNASIEQAFGKAQALTVSYVGSNGRKLLEQNEINVSKVNPDFNDGIIFNQNGLTSDYDALQVQFRRRLSRGLTALASYTWSHCLDYGSDDAALPYTRGNCDFDVRHNLSAAVSYSIPVASETSVIRAVFQHWGIDDRFTARTGFPVTLFNGSVFVDPVTGHTYEGGLDLAPGAGVTVPFYLYGSQYPGGRSINPAAFSLPPSNQVGDAARNFVRGFGAWQIDMAVRREFPIYERLRLQFRAEAFNVFNHPNFGTINSTYCTSGPGCTFGQATGTLAQSLGALSPLYQMGGPRSMQFALKLIF
jgi:hypothetical protein